MARIRKAMTERGADAWFEKGAQERFLKGLVANPAEWEQVTDILDVWFDSGSTHAFTLEDPEAFPGLAGIKRRRDGGNDRVMYLEGSDQHRGWFHSSLLESQRHARPRALRRRADARLRARREGAEDVEVARQHGGAPGRDQEFRRRHPAAVGGGVRLCGRPAHRPGNPEDVRRDLSQDAQHAALDARHAGALRSASRRWP